MRPIFQGRVRTRKIFLNSQLHAIFGAFNSRFPVNVYANGTVIIEKSHAWPNILYTVNVSFSTPAYVTFQRLVE